MFNSDFASLRAGAFCACLLLPVLLSGCASSSSAFVGAAANNGPITSVPRTSNNLQFTLVADKSVYKVGETVNFTLTVKNVSAQPISDSVTFPVADAVVMQQGQVVWQFTGGGTGGGASIGNGVLQPGDTSHTTFPFAWNQIRQSDGVQATPGQYTLTAWFNPQSLNGMGDYTARTDLAATPTQITLKAQ